MDEQFYADLDLLGRARAEENLKLRQKQAEPPRYQAMREAFEAGRRDYREAAAGKEPSQQVSYCYFEAGRRAYREAAASTKSSQQAPDSSKEPPQQESESSKHPPLRSVEMTVERACELLGVVSSSSTQEIKTAYRRKASQWHPDRLEGLAEELKILATNRMAEMNEAFAVLKASIR